MKYSVVCYCTRPTPFLPAQGTARKTAGRTPTLGERCSRPHDAPRFTARGSRSAGSGASFQPCAARGQRGSARLLPASSNTTADTSSPLTPGLIGSVKKASRRFDWSVKRSVPSRLSILIDAWKTSSSFVRQLQLHTFFSLLFLSFSPERFVLRETPPPYTSSRAAARRCAFTLASI